ncbi:MAG: tRNA 5-methoxyuridine(34)/uridine 5-oxyacetic acid(34) synthase CmoB [Helicobacteraceae bacterium]|nr:tRNA 5-methoxyuridine(34)/uridine 5-oxyacetic acid(34) synthase CmoB [Helicobacteraceae bacterium]
MQLSSRFAELVEAIKALNPRVLSCDLSDIIRVETDKTESYETLARSLKPWRKGPFAIDDLFIDSEWRSFIKYNLIAPRLNLEGKSVLDLGCNNGYYLFRMSAQNPAELFGFDPSERFFLQFAFINRFINAPIIYALKGTQDLGDFLERFDTIACLGVLYHRSDPIATLKAIGGALRKGGELILDTLIIQSAQSAALTPKTSYAKMPNVWFIPSVEALFAWLERTGFSDAETIAIKPTDTSEQRKTEWIDGESLGDFLDANDARRTVEGYPAPVRAYVRAVKR